MVHLFRLINIEVSLNLSCSVSIRHCNTIVPGVRNWWWDIIWLSIQHLTLWKLEQFQAFVQYRFEGVHQFFSQWHSVFTWLDHFSVNLVMCYMLKQRYILTPIVHSVNSNSLSVGIILVKLNVMHGSDGGNL